MDWSQIELKVYGPAVESRGLLALPKDKHARELTVVRRGSGWEVAKGAIPKVKFIL